jgi:hypothetical protein
LFRLRKDLLHSPSAIPPTLSLPHQGEGTMELMHSVSTSARVLRRP